MAQTSTNPNVNPNTTGGDASTVGGISVSADVTPAWGEDLPGWVDTLISMIVSGQSWPDASERLLWALAKEHQALGEGLCGAVEPSVAACRAVLSGWDVPATPAFLEEAGRLFSQESGVAGLGVENLSKALQADNFARETQYSKISINVAFWVAVTAAFIALVSAFFTAGATTPMVGPIAASARAAIGRILQRLAAVAGRDFGAGVVTRLASSGGTSLFRTVLTSHLGREIIEEIGEEVFIDAWTQRDQMDRGTRGSWDWKKTTASAVGAGGGAVVGMKIAAPLSRFSNRIPLLRTLNNAGGTGPGFGNAFARFPGRAVQTGLNNMAASPGGSILANGLVYGQWELPTGESLLGAAMGGAGRTNTISPFNPDVATALTHPQATLDAAYATATAGDAARTATGTSTPPNTPTNGTHPSGPATNGADPSGTVTSANGANPPSAPGSSHTPSVSDPGASSSGAQVSGSPSGNGEPATSGATTTQHTQGPPPPMSAQHSTPAQHPATTPTAHTGPTAQTAPTTHSPPAGDPSSATGTTPAVPTATTATAPSAQTQAPTAGPHTTPATQTAQTAQTAPPTAPPTAPDAAVPPVQQPSPNTATPPVQTSPNPSSPPVRTPPTGQSSGSPLVESVLARTVWMAAPGALPLRDGGTRVSGPDGRIVFLPPTALEEVRDHLTLRADDGAHAHRLQAEAAALVGAEIARGGRTSPVEGALDALGRVAEAAPEARQAATAVAREVLADNPAGWSAERLSNPASRLVETLQIGHPSAATVDPGSALRPSPHSQTAQAIVRQAEDLPSTMRRLSAPGTEDPSQRPGSGERGPGGGEVAARSIKRTAFVAEGREPHLPDANERETRAAAADVRASDLGRGVDEVSWPASSPTLRVSTENHGVQHFISRIGDVPHGRLARTEIHAGTEEDPHVVWFAPRVAPAQLARVWVHEISHVSQRLSTSGQPQQGVVRRYLPALNQAMRSSRDECVAARYDEHRYLTRQWESAGTEEERLSHRREIEGVAREIERRGHVPPMPPWSTTTRPASVTPAPSIQGTPQAETSNHGQVPSPSPVVTAVAELSSRVRGLAGSLAQAATDLDQRTESKRTSEQEARKRAEAASKKAEKAASQRDRGAAERQRKALAEAEVERDAAARYGRVADAYRRAQEGAEKAQAAYDATARALDRLASEQQAAQEHPEQSTTPDASTQQTGAEQRASRLTSEQARRVDESAAEVVRLAREGEARFAEYRGEVAKTLPPLIALASGVPTGRLPHLARLTEVVNHEVGADHRFTEDELLFLLRAEYRRLVSDDGVVLRRGNTEFDIKLRLGDLVEILDPAVKASELMVGLLPQGGGSVAASFARSVGLSGEFDATTLAKLVTSDQGIWALIKEGAPFAVLKGGYGRGRQASTTGSAAEYALAGAVEDNRGESSLFDAPATWEVRVRARGDQRDGAPQWRVIEPIGSGLEGDAASLRLWVSHAYTEHAPQETVQLPPEQRQLVPFPEHVVTGLTGLEELSDRTVKALRPGRAAIGSDTRDQLRVLLTDELPSRLGEAINSPDGLQRVITEDGRPVANVRLRTEVRLEPVAAGGLGTDPGAMASGDPGAVAVGTASSKHHQERLRVGFSGASGAESSGRSTSYSFTAGVKVGADVLLDGHGAGWTPRLAGNVTRASSRSDGLSAGGMAIHPSVQRWSGHTQGYRIRLEHTVTVRLLDESGPRPPVTGESEGLFRIPEPEAYRYGLPVDTAAIMTDPSGAQLRNPDRPVRLRDDPSPEAPPRREAVLPEWLGGGPGKARGAGPALVQRITGIDGIRAQVEDQLRRLGVLPELDDHNEPILSRDRLKSASQLINMREVAEQLSAERLETGYDQATQDGILVDLVRHRIGHAPEHFTLRVRLEQHAEFARYAGVTASETVVNLDIGSDTTARSSSRSTAWSGRGELGTGHAPADPGDTSLISMGGGADGQKTHGRSIGWSAGNTVNQVRLGEATVQVAIFEIPHTVRIERMLADGAVRPLLPDGATSEQVWARVLLASDMLPESDPPPAPAPHPTPPEVMRRATLLHMDAGDVLAAVRSVLPRGALPDSAALHHLAAFTNVRSLISHPWWTHSEYRTDLPIRPQGARPVRSSVSIRGVPGESRFVGAVDAVNGYINLTLGSSTTSATVQNTVTWDASTGLGAHQNAEPKGGTGTGVSASKTDSISRADTGIWGRERLTIEVGKQYVFRMNVGFEVTGDERGAHGTAPVTPAKAGGGTVVYMLPERDALLLYAEGRLPLPLHQVTDAMERFLDGNIQLDPVIAPPLVRRYLRDLHTARASGSPVGPLAARHTARQLLHKLEPMFGKDLVPQKGKPRHRLSNLLVSAAKLEKVKVALPEHYRRGMGQTSFESVTLTDAGGHHVELADAVMAAVKAASPKALDADPALRRALMGQFGGQNWWGAIDNMLEPNGFENEYTARTGPQQAEKIVLRVKARIDEGTPTLEGRSDEVGQINQNYDYGQGEASRSTGRSFSGNVGGDGAADGESGHGKLASHRGHTASGSAAQQLTFLQRVSSFDGADRVGHPIRISVEVERTPLSSGRAQAVVTRAIDHVRGEDSRRHVAPDLTGHVVRLVPDGLTARADQVEPEPAQRPDPRPVVRPERYYVESTEGETLLAVVADRLAARDLLGRSGMREHRTHLAHQLSAIARIARFKWMNGPQGHRMARLTVPGSHNEVVDVWIQAAVSEPHVIVGDREAVELGEVHRSQRTASVATGRSRVTPLSGALGGGHGPAGLGGDASFGDQASERTATSGGNRNETSVFEKGKVVTTRWRVDYHVRFERRTLLPDGGERPGTVVTLPVTPVGTAHLQMFGEDLRDVHAEMERQGPRGSGWRFDAPAQAGRRGWPVPWRRGRGEPAPVSLDELVAQARSDPGFERDPGAAMAEALRRADGVKPGTPVRLTFGDGGPPRALPVTRAQLLARALGTEVHLDVREPGDTVRRYIASPSGELSSDRPDGGFASALGTLPPALRTAADDAGIDLREVYHDRGTSGGDGTPKAATFADGVRGELGSRGIPSPAPDKPFWPTRLWGPGPEVSASSYLGGTGPVTAPPVDGTRFTAQGREPHLPDVSEDDLADAVTRVRRTDLPKGVGAPAWSPASGTASVDVPGRGTQHFSPRVGELPDGRLAQTELRSGTPGDPHVTTFAPRVDAAQLPRVWVHEFAESSQRLGAIEQGSRQGVIRSAQAASNPSGDPSPVRDDCLAARLSEHRYLTRMWRSSRTDGERIGWEREIAGLARVIEQRGGVPPTAPWSGEQAAGTSGAPAAGAPQESGDQFWARMRRLTNSTGWIPPEEKHPHPPGEPCRCDQPHPPSSTTTSSGKPA